MATSKKKHTRLQHVGRKPNSLYYVTATGAVMCRNLKTNRTSKVMAIRRAKGAAYFVSKDGWLTMISAAAWKK